jgi:hypothetical protein
MIPNECILFDASKPAATFVDLHKQNINILCPTCLEPLLIVWSQEVALEHQMGYGFYCVASKPNYHVYVSFHVMEPDFWERFHERHKKTLGELNLKISKEPQ